jgi:hypothetical protein
MKPLSPSAEKKILPDTHPPDRYTRIFLPVLYVFQNFKTSTNETP